MGPTTRKETLILAAALIIVAEVLFAGMGAAVKVLSDELPNTSVVFFRNFFAFIVLMPFILRAGVATLATQRLGLHVIRGVVGVTAMFCFFYALGHIQFAQAVLLKLTAPIFLPIIALLWLGERVFLKVGLGVAVGFLGVSLILKPGYGEIPAVALVGLFAGALAGLAQAIVRRMADTEPGIRIVFYFTFIATLVSAVPLAWQWVTPPPQLWGMLVLLGALGATGQLFMTRAFALAPAGRVGVFGYTSVLFASAFGWVFWGEIIDMVAWIGAVLIVLAGVLATQGRSAEESEVKVALPDVEGPESVPGGGPAVEAVAAERPAK